MGMNHLSSDDRKIVGECLAAAATGPFFPEWEFSTLFGVERTDVAQVMRSWPNVDEGDETVVLAVNNAITNLVGYPHGEDLTRFVSVAPQRLNEILELWQK